MSLAPAPSPNSLPKSKPHTLLLSVLSLGGREREKRRKEGLRTWPGLRGPKLSWPTLLAGSQDLESLTPLQSRAPGQPARAQAWMRRLQTQSACHAPKRVQRGWGDPAGCQPQEALPSRRTQPLFGGLPSLQRWRGLLPAGSPVAWDWSRGSATCGCRMTMPASLGGALGPSSPTGSLLLARPGCVVLLRPCLVAGSAGRTPVPADLCLGLPSARWRESSSTASSFFHTPRWRLQSASLPRQGLPLASLLFCFARQMTAALGPRTSKKRPPGSSVRVGWGSQGWSQVGISLTGPSLFVNREDVPWQRLLGAHHLHRLSRRFLKSWICSPLSSEIPEPEGRTCHRAERLP